MTGGEVRVQSLHDLRVLHFCDQMSWTVLFHVAVTIQGSMTNGNLPGYQSILFNVTNFVYGMHNVW